MELSFATLSIVIVVASLLDILEWVVKLPITIFHLYGDFLRWAADAVHNLFEDYGYLVVFFGTFLENTLFAGLIIPGTLVVLLAGLSAHDGTMVLPIAIAVGIFGTILGDTGSYLLGRYGWRYLERFESIRELEAKAREPIRRNGWKFILCYHFLGYTRLIGPAAAGLLRMPYRTWAPADYIGGSLWVTVYMVAGYLLGVAGLSLERVDRWVGYLEWALLIIVAVWGYSLYKLFMRSVLDGDEEPAAKATAAE